MLESIDSILRDRCLLQPNKPIVVGVSGGPDSLCLMEILRRAGYPLIVAHFNHHLRPESDAEATAVEKTASRFMVPSVVDGADVRLFAHAEGLSIEEAARTMRYRFLFEHARRHGAQAVAVGHTADDQVETVLMHFIRGAGLTGLKGMTYRTILADFDPEIPLIRPLLDVWREETILFCAANGLHPHYDPSNDSLDFLRNRLRHLLIPTLETYNPRFRETLWRTVRSLAADHATLNEMLDSVWKDCVAEEKDGVIVFDAPRFSTYSDGLQRNLLRRAIERLQPGQEAGFSVLERVTAFLAEPHRPSGVELVGGLRLFREGGQLFLAAAKTKLPFDRWPQLPGKTDSLPLAAPGQVELAGKWKFSAERWRLPALAWEQSSRNEDRFQVWLDARDLPENLELRVRRPGDRFEPLGMNGHSLKLSDFLINEKMPKRARDRWPLLCSGEMIIWVPGYRPAHKYRLRRSSKQVLYFALTSSSEEPAE